MSARKLTSVAVLYLLVSSAVVVACVAPALAATPPVIDAEVVEHVGFTSATLSAQVNPEESATTYHFEYGLSSSYGTSIPLSDAVVGAGTGDVAVTQTLSGLEPGSTYHFRVVAMSPEGIATGADHVLHTYATPEAIVDTCSNAQIRQTQFSSFLPECRAYEMVSPVEKGVGGANVAAAPRGLTQSSVDGNAIKYISILAYGDVRGIEGRGEEYTSSRTSEGWASNAITPRQESLPYGILTSSQYEAFSDDLSKGIFLGYKPIIEGHPNVARVTNLYLSTDSLSGPPGNYDLLSDSVEALPAQPGFVVSPEIAYVAASSDFSHILFESLHNLTAEGAGFNASLPKLYIWADGSLKLAGILPDESFAPESMPGRGSAVIGNTPGFSGQSTISSDGSRYVFLAPPFEEIQHANVIEYYGDLYLRDHAKTIKLNVSERSTPDPLGHRGAIFRGATPDGSKVFFTSYELLTDNASGAGPNGNAANLYMYDLNAPAGKHLTLISLDGEPSDNHSNSCECGGARSEYMPLEGVSEDGNYAYFISGNKLVAGQPDFKGEGLYVWHDGTVRVVTEHGEPGFGEAELGRSNAFRISSDGRYAAFVSGLESTGRQAGVELHNTQQVFVYDYEKNKLTCASCSSSGAAPSSNAGFEEESDTNVVSGYTSYLTRPLSRDGHKLFFDTADGLLPQDTNGVRDVYEYDVESGDLHLVSSGTSGDASTFVDASADGSNVFFTTRQPLVQADIDTAADLYDARVDGGIASQNEAPAVPCEGDDCQGPVKIAPVFSLPASSTFAGAGNTVKPSAGGSVRSRARPLTDAQKLSRAVRACKKKPKRERAACKVRARKRYGARKAGTSAHKSRRAGR